MPGAGDRAEVERLAPGELEGKPGEGDWLYVAARHAKVVELKPAVGKFD